MTKVSDSDGCVSWPTFRRWLGMFLGLAILLGAAVQAAAIPVAFADSGPVLSRAADLPAEPCEPGNHCCLTSECIASACYGFGLVAGSDADVLAWLGAPARLSRDRSIAGIAVLPPLHPPKNSSRI